MLATQTMMVTEFSRHVQGFLVHGVDRIVRVDWNACARPMRCWWARTATSPRSPSCPDGKLVSMLDVEQMLANASTANRTCPTWSPSARSDATVFFADDSAVARKEIVQVLDKLGVRHQHATQRPRSLGAAAVAGGARAGRRRAAVSAELQLILTDAEMPEMDGYVLTRRIKTDPRFDGIPVVMHSSLSSEANRSMGKSVGVDAYVAKFDPDVLADTLRPLHRGNNRPRAPPIDGQIMSD